MYKKIALVTLLMLSTTPALAETTVPAAPASTAAPSGTLQSETSKVLGRIVDDKFITINVENDMFGGGTDQNYTSGVRATYFDLGASLPAAAYALDKVIPTFGINKTTSISYSVGQNLYTPSDITQKTQNPGERPWAAFLYASAGLTTITNNHIDEVEASLGVVGPAALGEQTQKTIHKWVDSPTPQGWDNQLENEPALILSWQRRWPERLSYELAGITAGVEPHFGITLGNVYTYTNAGLSFRFSPQSGRWQDDPIRVRPSMPGTGAFLVPEGLFSWHVFGGIEGRAVGRNIFLDGNTFEDSYSVDKKIFVGDASAGVAFSYGKTRLSYALVYRTKEFDTQEDPSVFGTVSLGYRF